MFLRALTRTGKWLLYLLAGLLVLIALLTAIARFAVFQGNDYSERLASIVSRYVGSPVQIDKIDLVWDRFDAVANLTDIRVLSADKQQTDLILPSIELELNLRDMLLERNLSVRKVQLKGLSLVAEYKGRGELEILGREINSQRTDNGGSESTTDTAGTSRGRSALSWLFNAERIAILDSNITLTDQTRDTTYRIDNVDIRAFNDNDLHQIRISSALPGAIGKTSVASFDFTGSADNIREWNGQFYIDAKQVNLPEVSGYVDAGNQSIEGVADLQAWGRWRGTRINELRVLGAISDFGMISSAQQASKPAELSASSVGVDLDWKRDGPGWQATFNRFLIDFDNNPDNLLRFDGLDLSEVRDEYGVRQYRMAGPELDLSRLQPLVNYATAVTGSRIDFGALVGGRVSDWLLAGVMQGGKPVINAINAKISDMNYQSPHWQLSNAGASVIYAENSGQIDIAPQSAVSSTEFFSENTPPVNIAGTVNFTRTDDRWLFGSENLTVSNNDIKTRSTFNFRLNQFSEKLLDSVTSIEYVNLANAKHYLPGKGLKPRLRKWLTESILSGDIVRGQVTVSGNLSDFAPAQGRGELFGEVDIVDSTVKFRPDWPVARQMDGNLIFNANSMRGRIYQGAIREARFSDARLYLADFKNPLLEVQTNAIGPLDDMLDFAQRGPLANRIGAFFGDAKGSGASRLSLDLLVPLKRELRDQLEVDGSVRLENAQIDARRFSLDLESVTGEVRFNRKGVLLDDLLVRYLGIPVKVNAVQKQRGNKSINSIVVDGPIAVSSVLGSFGIPLTSGFEGISDWRVQLDVTRDLAGVKAGAKATVELTASSDLSGTAVRLPVPMNKAVDTIMAAKLYRNFSAKDKDWWVDIPGLAQMRMRIGEDRKLESMAIALGRSNNTVLPWRGIAVHGDVNRIDTMGWYRFASGFKKPAQPRNTEPFPLFAKVQARAMTVGTENVGRGVYIAFRDGEEQVHRVESAWVNGELRTAFNRTDNEPLVFRLDTLDKRLLLALGTDRKPADDNVTDRPFDPAGLPPMDAIVKELKWDNWRLSRVAARTTPVESGMRITSLTARQDAIRISGSGLWDVSSSGRHTTSLDLNASVDNLGKSVTALGGGESFADGEGEVALSLNWPDAAYRPDLLAMQGQLFVNFRDGRVLGVEPGAGRILGLFALQALPRRLTLDFRDILNTGLEYASVNGSFTIGGGRLASQTLLVTGPVAEILIHGHSDFVNRQYDQTIDVLPRVSGALPLIGVLSGGPAAGVTALVADGILKGLGVNLDEIGRRRFTLTGSWDSPKWETVNTQASR